MPRIFEKPDLAQQTKQKFNTRLRGRVTVAFRGKHNELNRPTPPWLCSRIDPAE